MTRTTAIAWTARLAFVACLTCSATTLVGCDFFLQPSKVGHGQLYQSGESRYDSYFSTVHQEQLAAAAWPDDAKASRKPIVTALALPPEASNSRILGATRSKKGHGALGSPIEQAIAAELARARKLTATAARLDELQRRGNALKSQAVEERQNLGADKADPGKVAKKDEVKREISAAVDAVESMASDARKGAEEATELASKLRAAWSGRDEDKRPKSETPSVMKKPDGPKPSPSEEKPPGSDEVFSP